MSSPKSNTMSKAFKIVLLKRWRNLYPEREIAMCVSEESMARWETFLNKTPISDDRLYRRACEVVDYSRFAYTVEEGENTIFLDKDTRELVLAITSNVIDEPKVLDVIQNAVVDNNNKSQQMRADDPGILTQVGLTTGKHDNRSIDWAANLKKMSPEQKATHRYRMSCVFAHAWEKVLQSIPDKYRDIVLADYKEGMAKIGGLQMDGGSFGAGDQKLRYEMKIHNEVRKFETTFLAPPSGMTARNYAKHTHNEDNLNGYATSFTTERSHPAETGGNFYLSNYRLRVPNRRNQTVIWRGKDYHGTIYPDVDPEDEEPKWCTAGIAFIMGTALKGAYNKMMGAGKLEDLQNQGLEKMPSEPADLTDSVAKPGPVRNMGKRKNKEVEDRPSAAANSTNSVAETSSVKKSKKRKYEELEENEEPDAQEEDKPGKLSQFFLVPDKHPYTDTRKWTIKNLNAEIKRRVQNGREIEWKDWWKRKYLVFTLILDDGELELKGGEEETKHRVEFDEPSPASEEYSKKHKRMTKKDIIAEIEKRVANGHKLEFRPSWLRPVLLAILEFDDAGPEEERPEYKVVEYDYDEYFRLFPA